MRRVLALTMLLVVALTACSGSSDPTATYAGDGCDYDGPSEFDVDTDVTFTVTNDSDITDVGFAIWRFPSGVTPEEIFSEGIFQAVGPDDDSTAISRPPTPIGEPVELRASFDTPGQWGINCFAPSDGSPGTDHTTMFTVNE